MSSFRRSERVSLVVPTRQKKRKADVLSNVEKIVEKREALLQERKTKLESVVDKHDALVRELYLPGDVITDLSRSVKRSTSSILCRFCRTTLRLVSSSPSFHPVLMSEIGGQSRHHYGVPTRTSLRPQSDLR